MAGYDLTAAAYKLQTAYTSGPVQQYAQQKHAALSMARKEGGWGGDGTKVLDPIEYSAPMGIGPTLGEAQALNSTSTLGKRFALTKTLMYGSGTIDRLAMAAVAGGPSWKPGAEVTEAKNSLSAFMNRFAVYFWGDGSGSLGKVSAVSGGVITLDRTLDAAHFFVGMKVGANPTRSGTFGDFRSGIGTITNVNIAQGKLTYSGTITSIAANDYLYAATSSSDSTLNSYDAVVKGLLAWVPATTPAATAFFGVDRSVDPVRFAGSRLNTPSLSVAENAINLAVQCHSVGGDPKVAFTSPQKWADLVKDLDSKIMRDDDKDSVTFGRSYVVQQTPGGDIKHVSDINCPDTCLLMGDPSDIVIDHAYDSMVLPIAYNANDIFIPSATADSVEYRTNFWGQVSVRRPINWGHAILA